MRACAQTLPGRARLATKDPKTLHLDQVRVTEECFLKYGPLGLSPPRVRPLPPTKKIGKQCSEKMEYRDGLIMSYEGISFVCMGNIQSCTPNLYS